MGGSCCQTDYDALFDDRAARRELAEYRRRGARGTTARLIDAIRGEGVEGASLLDIGGGVGVIGAELLRAGAASLTDVDASRPYLVAGLPGSRLSSWSVASVGGRSSTDERNRVVTGWSGQLTRPTGMGRPLG